MVSLNVFKPIKAFFLQEINNIFKLHVLLINDLLKVK